MFFYEQATHSITNKRRYDLTLVQRIVQRTGFCLPAQMRFSSNS